MTDTKAGSTEPQNLVDKAVAEGGAYEVLNRRLQDQGSQLQQLTKGLNDNRIKEFGDSRMEVIGRTRIRTEHNCVARDIVRVGDNLMFGYNVFIGLKEEINVSDVFGIYRLIETEDSYDTEQVPTENTFLNDPVFLKDFRELYTYYKNTRLLLLTVRGKRLLACFQTGQRINDVRVFRWQIPNDNDLSGVRYIDSRGESDIAFPSPYDFKWIATTRESIVDTARALYLNVADTLFIEQKKGMLSLKIENNTPQGQVILKEKVDDVNQALGDMRVEYAELESLLLVRLLPYGEKHWRYWVYNKISRTIVRIDAIGQACVQLPEGHGIIFPGGYYLQNGEHKTFDISMEGMRYKRAIKSPNGEDVLYIFYEEVSGCSLLLMYDVISRELAPPILAHGHARLEDGRMVIFHTDGAEQATRIHPMQIWATPFYFDEYADRLPPRNGFYGRIGNAELVRGVSDFYELYRAITSSSVSIQRYTLLTQNVRKLFDAYHWLDDPQVKDIAALLRDIATTSEAVLDEYEKVESIRTQSAQRLADAQKKQEALLASIYPDGWRHVQEFVDALNQINAQRGLLLTIRELRYMDTDAVAAMETRLQQAHEQVATATADFLASDTALQPFVEQLQELDKTTQAAQTVLLINEPLAAMQEMANDLDMLTSLMGTLQISDATQHTRIIEAISEVYAKLNQSKARAEQRKKELGSTESIAQFAAQFQLFGQSVVSALSLATDPEKCDEQLSRLLIQLEEAESQFGMQEEFLNDILAKREEVLETFEGRKQALLDERQRKAQNIQDAALRILETLPRRIARSTTVEEINAFFAADPLVLKLKELIDRLHELHDSMRADDVDARIKSARDQALRSLRDKTDLFENDGNVIRLGAKHRFSVNAQELDLTLLPRNDKLYIHLTGTEFFEPIQNPELDALKEYWLNAIESETPDLYRGEYLAAQILLAARDEKEGLSLDLLKTQLPQFDQLSKTVRDFATPRYKEGYEKGIHDHDAALILNQLIPTAENADLQRFPPLPRALACLYWSEIRSDEEKSTLWIERARTSQSIQKLFHLNNASTHLQNEIAQHIQNWIEDFDLPHDEVTAQTAAEYLLQVLSFHRIEFVSGKYAKNLYEALRTAMQADHVWTDFEQSLEKMKANPGVQWLQAENALKGLCHKDPTGTLAPLASYIPGAIVLCLIGENFPMRYTETDLFFTVSDMMGTHPRIVNQQMTISVDGFFERVRKHLRVFLPNLQRYHAIRQNIIQHERATLKLDDFKPKPLTSFVRNRLINDVYLPVIGDNLAKQIGTVGENKRTDLMGLLMLISPPGYGKTTLMEYIAHRLGLIFMRINGPALGHRVLSLDPAQAPDATSAQELEKLNLALEMGNNVMLYVDDIQHTSPEFLQKFISLSDGTRRIEGVWKGQTKTFDMRGRRFCVVMAGNPYTESGEVFKIPDMLANRADIYNLGETLGGMEEAFALSYIENSLTSNAALAPLATREMEDVYRFIAKAQGQEVSNNEFKHDYSAAEINEIVNILKRMLTVRDLLFKVNKQYIASAAQADNYRTEPAFKLQGSYRNMNRLAEKISAVMNDKELTQLIDDHYQNESQLLTTGAEENLLKLAELRGILTQEQQQRWEQIKQDFKRNKAMGGSDVDVGTRVVAQLHDLVDELRAFAQQNANKPAQQVAPWEDIIKQLGKIASSSSSQKELPQPHVEVQLKTQPQPEIGELLHGIATALEQSFIPVVKLMDKKLDVDLSTQRRVTAMGNSLKQLAALLGKEHLIETTQDDSKDIYAAYGSMPKKSPKDTPQTARKTPDKK